MAATDQAPDVTGESPKKKGMLIPLVLGLVLAGAGGAGGYFAVAMGLIGGGGAASEPEQEAAKVPAALDNVAFVPLDPILVDLGPMGSDQILRFRAEVEVDAAYETDVAGIAPRIVDVINGYLRAVDPVELEQPAALLRLRTQLLRRVQLVAGEGRVRDLLVMEFVLN